SMATPMVSGAAALMLAANKSLTWAQLKSRLINGADESASLFSRSVSHGKLNVANAVRNVTGIRYSGSPFVPFAASSLPAATHGWVFHQSIFDFSDAAIEQAADLV